MQHPVEKTISFKPDWLFRNSFLKSQIKALWLSYYIKYSCIKYLLPTCWSGDGEQTCNSFLLYNELK